jgi:hypothetical protein
MAVMDGAAAWTGVAITTTHSAEASRVAARARKACLELLAVSIGTPPVLES